MAKQGQHHNDGNDPDVSRGPNNPRKSQPITTGTPKKRETYEAQYREHENPGKQAQRHEPHWDEQTPRKVSKRDIEGSGERSRSDSNADAAIRGH